MTLGRLKTLCRLYCNQMQVSNLTDAVLVEAINDARCQWFEFVGFPLTQATLTVAAQADYATSTLYIKDIESVYLGSVAPENRLRPWEREDVDQTPTDTSTTTSTEESTPLYYRYEELMVNSVWQKRFYLYDANGSVSLTAATTLIVNYNPMFPTPYVAGSADEILELEIPEAHCYDLKYFVSFFHCRRIGEESTREREWSRWKGSQLYADMMRNYAKKDAHKCMRDTLAYARERYKSSF